MWLKLLRPGWINVLLTLVIMFTPVVKERALLSSGGYAVAHYSPMFLLSTYLMVGEYYPFLLMVGFAVFVYVVSSVVAGVLKWPRKKK